MRIIKSCFGCKFHEIREDAKEKMGYCRRENCWSRHSKCVATKALKWYLEKESSEEPQRKMIAA